MVSFHFQKLDDVDIFLAKQSGKIERGLDPRVCRHNNRQRCSNCLPLDPYDENYLKERDIKHMSFHSYVRKLTAGRGTGTQLNKPLEIIICKLKPNCPSHKPYPMGICSKCRPPVVTLNRQRYRHVDNISIENEEVVNRFLAFWRKTGNQRIGYLIGRYESFSEVPLGIKATVAAIYEPPQSCSPDSVLLLDDPNDNLVDELCSCLNLKRVGWIFTDLWSSNAAKGSVHYTRHKDSFFLSAKECITAGWLQNKYPNITNYCTEGAFGSKFVTLVASGNESEHIHFSGYQVSNQCAALVEADVLCPTNHPELAYLRDRPLNPTHYIPDVQYMEKNEYGAETRRDGRPMPVEYLLVDVPAGMPKELHATFHITKGTHFPTENRSSIGELQDTKAVSQYASQFSSEQFLELVTNFHFLFFLVTNNIVKFSKDELKELCQIIQEQDRAKASEWALNNANWATFTALCRHSHEDEISKAAVIEWSCNHCTFKNIEERVDCAICGLPRDL
ncbi:unnamed protein product [Dracunculus medinensis]|uniref:Nuclear protein localization protein 4 homolog n=1 Tax=Dracunculus medinensis TaxID=318479 RepID=A0A0N4ULJ7_DRAME|nr:unnamed protein product [Dracunculus medinensis]